MVYLLCHIKLRNELQLFESLYKYCIEACRDGCKTSLSCLNWYMTIPHIRAANTGHVFCGASMILR